MKLGTQPILRRLRTLKLLQEIRYLNFVDIWRFCQKSLLKFIALAIFTFCYIYAIFLPKKYFSSKVFSFLNKKFNTTNKFTNYCADLLGLVISEYITRILYGLGDLERILGSSILDLSNDLSKLLSIVLSTVL